MKQLLSYRFFFHKKAILSKGIIIIDESKYMDIRNIFDLSALIKQLKPLRIKRINW
jgi:glutamate synthase domain-containing protein 2